MHSKSTGLHDLEINYIGINLSAPERTQYRYRLLGEDKNWQEVGKRRQAFYTRLNPGSYQFQVSASNGEEWTDSLVPLRLEVSPAIYQTWWFNVSCLLLGLGVAWLIWRARIRFVTEQVHSLLSERLAERERVARELHDTLLQGFQGLMMRFHLATQSIPSTDPARSEMEEALDSADLLLVESRDRIRDLRYETLQQVSISEALTALADEFAEPSAWQLQIVTRDAPRDLNPVSYWEIYAIAKEALINSFRHSEASEILVTLSFDTARFTIEVTDNGQGIDPDVLNGRKRANHWGLSGMRERAANLRAELKIVSSPGRGTAIKLSIPAALAYQTDRSVSRLRIVLAGLVEVDCEESLVRPEQHFRRVSTNAVCVKFPLIN